MLKVQNVSKVYHNKNKANYANKNISLELSKGQIVGFLGANGAGKTTLIKSICNLISIDEGEIYIGGENIHTHNSIINKKVGVMLEGSRNIYYFLSVYDNLKYFSLLNNITNEEFESKIAYYIDLFELKDKLNEKVNNLSRGMKQKVSLLNILIKDPEIIILDEPTLGMDITSKERMISLIQEIVNKFNKTVILCSHDLEVVEKLCQDVVFFEEGKVMLYETVESIMTNISNSLYKALVRIGVSELECIDTSDYEIVNHDNSILEVLCNDINQIYKTFENYEIIEIIKQEISLNKYIKGIINNGND